MPVTAETNAGRDRYHREMQERRYYSLKLAIDQYRIGQAPWSTVMAEIKIIENRAKQAVRQFERTHRL